MKSPSKKMLEAAISHLQEEEKKLRDDRNYQKSLVAKLEEDIKILQAAHRGDIKAWHDAVESARYQLDIIRAVLR